MRANDQERWVCVCVCRALMFIHIAGLVRRQHIVRHLCIPHSSYEYSVHAKAFIRISRHIIRLVGTTYVCCIGVYVDLSSAVRVL